LGQGKIAPLTRELGFAVSDATVGRISSALIQEGARAGRVRLVAFLARRALGQTARERNTLKPNRSQHSLMNPTNQLYRAISAFGF
jgi:hypothetical protein